MSKCVITLNLDEVQLWYRDLMRKQKSVFHEVHAELRGAAELILAETRRNIATAPPPIRARPKRRTGPPFADTFRIESQAMGYGMVQVSVGTDAPYGHRYEVGFVGQDVLGRHYNQIPRPVLGPAADSVEPILAEYIRDIGERIP